VTICVLLTVPLQVQETDLERAATTAPEHQEEPLREAERTLLLQDKLDLHKFRLTGDSNNEVLWEPAVQAGPLMPAPEVQQPRGVPNLADR
jgi:hypothetical protein